MFAYRHGYHAGNHADVLKHLTLVTLLDALRRKDKPFFVMDTHAGDGGYALDSAMAGKLAEYADGIGRLWPHRGLHPAIDGYLDAVATHNTEGRLAQYPGSPLIVADRLRVGDRLLAVEAHSAAGARLDELLSDHANAQVLRGDGYAALKAALPPRERRGLILIDPSFEVAGEFERLTEALRLIHHRFRQGLVAIWYPLLGHKPAAPWLDTVQNLGIPDILTTELRVGPPTQGPGLYGSGMLLVNPPWGIESQLREVLPMVSECLNGHRDGACVRTLVGEQGEVAPRA